MVRRVTGLIEKSILSRPIIGYTNSNTVMLDFDNMGLGEAKYWALKIMREFKLEGFLILESSKRNYHVVFNRFVSWSENMSIVSSLCIDMKHEALTKWFLLQCRKQEPTLRLSAKGKKHSPRIVFSYGKQGGEINHYLQYRRIIKLSSKR